LAFLTRDKIEELGKKFAEEAKLSEVDGRKLVDEFLKKSEDAKAALERTVSAAVGTALEKLDIPRRAELKAMESRIQALESRVQALEGKAAGRA
jgi:polyhydroxyalkanoate synthesis regulator phasin